MVGLGLTPAGRPSPPAIILRDVAIGRGGQPLLRDINLTLAPGSLTALVGPNGGGKSTLLMCLAGEIVPLRGRIDIRRDVSVRTAFLPQDFPFDRTFPISVRYVVAMGLWPQLGPFGRLGRSDAQQVSSALAAVGLAGFERRLVGELSGGELQRVLFARLSLLNAAIILLDEPFAAVDRETVAALMRIIRGWHDEGRTVIASLHDFDQVRSLFPETMRLSDGLLTHGPTDQILADVLRIEPR